jgi:hypothetical protein
MKHIGIATLLFATLSLVGCKKDVTDAISSWKDDACACKDKGCAEKQADAFWKLAEKFKDDKPSSKDEAKKLDKMADEGQACLEKHGVDVFGRKAG